MNRVWDRSVPRKISYPNRLNKTAFLSEFSKKNLSLSFRRTGNPLAPDAPDMTSFTSVSEWLSSIKMARYLDNFDRGGIASMEAVVRLTVAELNALGITLVGHQKKIMNSIQAMRTQLSANLSEGFLV